MNAMNRLVSSRNREVRLSPRLIPLLLVKVVALGVIWFLFVRGQQAPLSERDVATSFGLGDPTANPKLQSKGASHGQ